jgi:DNA invertase Pin-like site-specific DNA recombinase
VVEFEKEKLTFTSETNAMSKLLLSVMGAFAEFERSLIKERQCEGIAIAKKAGVYKGRKLFVNYGAGNGTQSTCGQRRKEGSPGTGVRHKPRDTVSVRTGRLGVV